MRSRRMRNELNVRFSCIKFKVEVFKVQASRVSNCRCGCAGAPPQRGAPHCASGPPGVKPPERTKVMPSLGRSRVCSAPLRAALRTGNVATPRSSPKEPDAVDALVGHNIRIQRHARRMSQTALAERLGVTFQQVQKYEGGVNRVGAGRLTRIAAVLGVPVTALLD